MEIQLGNDCVQCYHFSYEKTMVFMICVFVFVFSIRLGSLILPFPLKSLHFIIYWEGEMCFFSFLGQTKKKTKQTVKWYMLCFFQRHPAPPPHPHPRQRRLSMNDIFVSTGNKITLESHFCGDWGSTDYGNSVEGNSIQSSQNVIDGRKQQKLP